MSVTGSDAMDINNPVDFLANLDQVPAKSALEVYRHAKSYLPAAVREVGFHDLHGPDYLVLGRLEIALSGRDSEAALWSRVFLDLWFGSNFGGRYWHQLVARHPANARFAVEAAFWVLTSSGKDGRVPLAGIFNRWRCWWLADPIEYRTHKTGAWAWFQRCVVPLRTRGRAGRNDGLPASAGASRGCAA